MDGIWLDMNEVTSFCNGRCSKATNDGEKNYTYPYNPTGDTKYTIQSMTLPLDGQHYGITKEQNETNIEYNLHSLYGTHRKHLAPPKL